MKQFIKNVAVNGILEAPYVRPKNNGRYEIVAGHKRIYTNKANGNTEIRCVVKSNLSDLDAKALMLYTNTERTMDYLPSEKVFSYKLEKEVRNQQRKELKENKGKQKGA